MSAQQKEEKDDTKNEANEQESSLSPDTLLCAQALLKLNQNDVFLKDLLWNHAILAANKRARNGLVKALNVRRTLSVGDQLYYLVNRGDENKPDMEFMWSIIVDYKPTRGHWLWFDDGDKWWVDLENDNDWLLIQNGTKYHDPSYSEQVVLCLGQSPNLKYEPKDPWFTFKGVRYGVGAEFMYNTTPNAAKAEAKWVPVVVTKINTKSGNVSLLNSAANEKNKRSGKYNVKEKNFTKRLRLKQKKNKKNDSNKNKKQI